MTAEEYLNKYCKPDDWNNLEECLKDSILTNNVIEHMELYAALRKNDVVGRSEQLKAVERLIDFAYEVCPLHREDDLKEIRSSL
jgi:hypothetical protein